MINWILSQPGLMKFVRASTKRQNGILLEHQNQVDDIRKEMHQRLAESHRCADLIQTMTSNDISGAELSRERDKLRQAIAGVYSSLKDFTRRLLWLELHRAMSVDGFVMPDKLIELRKDIDYGFFNLPGLEGLEDLIDSDPDPFDELEIELSSYL